jgi:WD40 repeat protein
MINAITGEDSNPPSPPFQP